MMVVNFLNFKTFFSATYEIQPKMAPWVLFLPVYTPDRQQLTHQVEGVTSTSAPETCRAGKG